jgi:hypothetical protein
LATRLYFHDTTSGLPSGTLPAAEQSTLASAADWEAQTINHLMDRFLGTSGVTASLVTGTIPATGNRNYYVRRFVSSPINQTSIAANTWTLNISADNNSGSSAHNFPSPLGSGGGSGGFYLCAYVWRPSTGTKYGNLFDGATTTTGSVGSTPTSYNVTISGSAVSSLVSGDAVIVIEIWGIVNEQNTTGYTQHIYYDGNVIGGTGSAQQATYIQTPENLTITDGYVEKTLYFHDTTSGLPSGTLPSAEQSAKTVSNASNNWEGSQTTNRLMNITKGSAQASRTFVTEATASARTMYVTRFVSPLLYQTSIPAGTWVYNFAALEQVTTCNFPCNGNNKAVYVCLYAWKPSNGTKYANIFDANSTGATASEGAANVEKSQEVTFSGAAVSSLVSGDVVLVFEVWFDMTQGTATANNLGFYYDGTTETAGGSTVSNHASFIKTLGMDLNFTAIITRSISEPSISFSDALARLASKFRAIANTITFTDNVTRSALKKRSISEPSVVFSDSISIVVTTPVIMRNISDSIPSISDSVSRSALKKRSIANSVTFGDSVTRFKKAIVALSNSLSLTDTVTRSALKKRSLADTVTFGDSINRFKKAIRTIANTVTFGDSITKQRIVTKSINNTVTFGDSISRFKKAIRALTNTVTFSDSITKQRTVSKLISNTVTFGDSVSRFKKAIKAISESITFTDSSTRKKTAIRTIANTVPLSDSVTRKATKSRSLADTIIFSDSIVKLRTVLKTISNTVTFSDSISKSAKHFISIPNTITFNDIVNRFKKANRTISDNINFTDSVARQKLAALVTRSISETVTFVDNVVRKKLAYRIINETISFTDNVIRKAIKSRSISESIPFTDSVARQKLAATITRSISETITFTDSVLRSRKVIKSISNTISFLDTVTRSALKKRSLSENISFTDSVTGLSGKIVSIFQSISFNDSVTRSKKANRSISESIPFTDNISKSVKRFKSLIESIIFTDIVTRSVPKSVNISDSISFSDTITIFRKAVRNLVEIIPIHDLLSRFSTNRPVDELLEMHPHEIINDYIRDNWLTDIESDWYLLPMKDKIFFQDGEQHQSGDFQVWVSNVSSKIDRHMTDNQYAFYQDIVAIRCNMVYYPEPDHIKMKWHIRSFIEYLVEKADLESQGITNLKIISVKEDDFVANSNTYQKQNISTLIVFALAQYTLLKIRL